MWFSCFKPRWNGVPCFFLCFVHLFRSFSKFVFSRFVGSNELRFIYNDSQERSKINALTIQQRNMTMENHGICVISFNMIPWFLISMLNMCLSQPCLPLRKHDRLSWVTGDVINDFQLKAFEPVGDPWQFDQTTTGPDDQTYFQSVSGIHHIQSQASLKWIMYIYIYIHVIIID